MRVLTYYSYVKNCEKMNKKIVDFSLKNYEDKKIFNCLEDLKERPKPSKERQVFNDILAIRRINFENIENYDFIVKEVRKQQKLMDTRKIIGL